MQFLRNACSNTYLSFIDTTWKLETSRAAVVNKMWVIILRLSTSKLEYFCYSYESIPSPDATSRDYVVGMEKHFFEIAKNQQEYKDYVDCAIKQLKGVSAIPSESSSHQSNKPRESSSASGCHPPTQPAKAQGEISSEKMSLLAPRSSTQLNVYSKKYHSWPDT